MSLICPEWNKEKCLKACCHGRLHELMRGSCVLSPCEHREINVECVEVEDEE
jgi:hypothetical protein